MPNLIKNKKVTGFESGPLPFSFGKYHDKFVGKLHKNGSCRSQQAVGIRMQLKSVKECHLKHCQCWVLSRVHYQSQSFNCSKRKALSPGLFSFFKSAKSISNFSIPSLNSSPEIEDVRQKCNMLMDYKKRMN